MAAGLLLAPGLASAGTAAGTPFPSNLLTTPDATQLTGLRVALPTPDCATRPSDCADIAVLNRLDGFNVQPRVSIPFDGPIDPSTVSSDTVRLYDLGCLACAPIGIDQSVWEPAANTLHAESAALLKQHETYLLVATTGLHAADGSPLDRSAFLRDLNFGQTKDEHTKRYRTALRDALQETGTFTQAAAASIFTTQSVTADLEKIRAQLDESTPAPARVTASFPRAQITAIVWNRQATTTGPLSPSFVPVPALDVFPGSVGRVVFGTYDSPDYLTPAKVIPATGTRTGTPGQGTNTISYTLFLPSGTEPTDGWPVTIFGHGFTDSKQGAPWTVASSLAHAGIASIAINVVGHGGGAGGNLTVVTPTGPTVIPDGGRGIDQDGNGTIDSTEGVNAAPPDTLVSNRDGLRQTVIDLMQLVREVQVGVDVDGNGTADLDAARIFYAGQSFGGIYGIDFVALEPHLVAGVANVPGGPIIEIARLSPSFRPLVGLSLLGRTPSLYNAAPNPPFFTSFVENMPLRGEPLRIDTVPGASAIQELIDRNEWAQQSANPVALAPYVDHPVIVQFAKGDRTVPNPTTSALLRAGDLAGRATFFRNDIAGPGGTPLYPNPHTFLTGIGSPATALAALQAQAQIAAFFASNGVLTIDPDGAGPVFEVPIAGPLPETTGF